MRTRRKGEKEEKGKEPEEEVKGRRTRGGMRREGGGDEYVR